MMNISWFSSFFLIFFPFLFLLNPFVSALSRNGVDIVVYGATPAGISAALSAASIQSNQKIALLEPSCCIGGMSTQGGIGMRDFVHENILKGYLLDWAKLNAKHYQVDYPVWQPDHYVGNHSFWNLIESFPNIQVIPNQQLEEIQKIGATIQRITTKNVQNHQVFHWDAKVFIDASYEGDLMIQSGASFTHGRESQAQYNESYGGVTNASTAQFEVPFDVYFPNGTLLKYIDSWDGKKVGDSDDRLMGYSYRLCITQEKKNQIAFSKPFNYNPEDFELVRRYYQAMKANMKTPKLPFNPLKYRSYPPHTKFDMCDSHSPINTDVVNINRGYATGSNEERKKIAQEIRYFLQGLIWFLMTDDSVPSSIQKEMNSWGLCKDEWAHQGHWPILYVREASRLVGDQVFTQQDRIGGIHRNESIGLGNWGFDIHLMQRYAFHGKPMNEGATRWNTGGQPIFEVPYWILLPKRKEVSNLLVPVCPSVSHVAFSAMREEPALWGFGAASGIAASISAKNDIVVHDVSIQQIQMNLKKQGYLFHHP